MTHPQEPLIDAEHARFITGPVMIVVASCGADRLPNLARGAGCRIEADLRQVTVFVEAGKYPALLADVRANRSVAVVFSRPTTNRTLQLKGSDATIGRPAQDDLAVVAGRCELIVEELGSLGNPQAYTRAAFHVEPADIVAIRFTAGAAFQQTPGPGAGRPLGDAR